MKDDKRTDAQNHALHQWFSQLANEMNDSGLEQQITIDPKIDVPWTQDTVKILFKKIALAQYGKIHTSDLTKEEFSGVQETFNRFLADRGLHVPFPSLDVMVHEMENNKRTQ